MKESIIKAGADSGMLNYVDNETPRRYFIAHWADEECLEKFADLIIEDVIDIIKKEWYTLNDIKTTEVDTARDVGFRLGKKTQNLVLIAKIRKHFEFE